MHRHGLHRAAIARQDPRDPLPGNRLEFEGARRIDERADDRVTIGLRRCRPGRQPRRVVASPLKGWLEPHGLRHASETSSRNPETRGTSTTRRLAIPRPLRCARARRAPRSRTSVAVRSAASQRSSDRCGWLKQRGDAFGRPEPARAPPRPPATIAGWTRHSESALSHSRPSTATPLAAPAPARAAANPDARRRPTPPSRWMSSMTSAVSPASGNGDGGLQVRARRRARRRC